MKIKVHYTMYIFFLISYFCDLFKETFIMFILLLLHELGHLFFLKKYKREVQSITFFPFGGVIKHSSSYNDSIIKDFLICSGGVIVNIILALIFYFLKLEIWFMFNLCILIFNIIPIHPLDGSKILSYLINFIICYKTSLYINIIISITTILFVLYINLIYFESMYIFMIIITLLNINIRRIFVVKKDYNFFLANRYLYPNNKLKEKRIYRFKKPLNKVYLGKNCVYILDEFKIKEFDILKQHFSYI